MCDPLCQARLIATNYDYELVLGVFTCWARNTNIVMAAAIRGVINFKLTLKSVVNAICLNGVLIAKNYIHGTRATGAWVLMHSTKTQLRCFFVCCGVRILLHANAIKFDGNFV